MKTIVALQAKTARQARAEISASWPTLDVNYKGYNKDGECVLMSLVRKQGDKAYVATASKNRAGPAVRFEAEIPIMQGSQASQGGSQ